MKSTLNLPLKADAGTIGRGENLTWDQSAGTTGGWSSRLGYEPYFLDSYEPFGAVGRVDSLYVWEMAPALHFIFFEAGGTLYLVHEFGGGTPDADQPRDQAAHPNPVGFCKPVHSDSRWASGHQRARPTLGHSTLAPGQHHPSASRSGADCTPLRDGHAAKP
jgi:hypothetical protein